jgi:hypothetical protein
MGIENFIEEAHYKPNDYIAYHVGRELAELHPGKTIVEGHTWYFDLEAFVRDEKCSLVEQKSVFHHATFQWEAVGKPLKPRIENSWLNVLWQGQLFDVVLITWSDGCRQRRHHWIIADERKPAEEFINAVCEWSCEVRGEILVFENGYFQKDRDIFNSIKSSNFDTLILPVALKQQIQDDFHRFFDSRELYEQHGIPWRRGAIFIGSPGNGKTHTLKALVNQLNKPCIYVRGLGEDEYETSELFQHARNVAPCVMVLEDLDSMINDENRAFFLNELDGFRANTGVVVLATTNHPEKLDTAILDRPSRFDRKYHFVLPAETERSAYLARWNDELKPEMRLSETGTATVISKSEGFSFAYLKEMGVASMLLWIAAGGAESMDTIAVSQTELLRKQMGKEEKKEDEDKESWFSRLFSGSWRK